MRNNYEDSLINLSTIVVCIMLIMVNLIYANFGVWTGRGNINNFTDKEPATIAEVQAVYAKKNFFDFFFSTDVIHNREKAINDFWNASNNTPYEFSNEVASLEMVHEVYPEAENTTRGAIYAEHVKYICYFAVEMTLFYFIILFLLFLLRLKEFKLIVTLIYFNLIYSITVTVIGGMIPLIALNFIILLSRIPLTSDIILNNKVIKKIKKYIPVNLKRALLKFPNFSFFFIGHMLLFNTVLIIFAPSGFIFYLTALALLIPMVMLYNGGIGASKQKTL